MGKTAKPKPKKPKPAPKCTAKSKTSGKRCAQPAIPGGAVCRFHGGGAPQVQRKAAERLEATKERVLLEMCRIAYVDPRDLFTKQNRLINFSRLDIDTARAIAGVAFDAFGGVKSIKLTDKKGALDSLMRHLGMFKDKLEIEGTLTTIAERLVKARKRVHAKRDQPGK
jgi:hypothetical protein